MKYQEMMTEIGESGELERAEEIAGRFPDARVAAVDVRPLMGGSAEDL